MTARLIHTSPGIAFRARRLVRWYRLRFLRWNLACLRDERETYTNPRKPMGGPLYLLESWNRELRLRKQIRELEGRA